MEGTEKQKEKNQKRRNFFRLALNFIILLGLVVAAQRYLNGEEVLAALRNFEYSHLPLILFLSVLYMVIKAYRFVLFMRPVSQLPSGVFFRGHVAGTAATLLPGGVSLRAALMQQAGVPVAASTPGVLYSSLLDQVALISGALAAAIFYEPIRLTAMVISGILFVILLLILIPAVRRVLDRASTWLFQRFKWEKHWKHFLQALKEVSSVKVLITSMLLTYVGLFLLVFIFYLVMIGFNSFVSYPILFLAYVVPTVVGRLVGTPGGFGVTEAGMVGFLASIVEISPDLALAASAFFRIIVVVFQAALGALVYFFFWKGEEERLAPSKEREIDHVS